MNIIYIHVDKQETANLALKTTTSLHILLYSI